MGRILKGKL